MGVTDGSVGREGCPSVRDGIACDRTPPHDTHRGYRVEQDEPVFWVDDHKKLTLSSEAQELHREFMGAVDGDESPQYYIALSVLMLAGEVRALREKLEQHGLTIWKGDV